MTRPLILLAAAAVVLACGDPSRVETLSGARDTLAPDTAVADTVGSPDTQLTDTASPPEDTSVADVPSDGSGGADTTAPEDTASGDTSAGCDSPFVYLEDGQLRLGDAPFVPVSVNFIFDIRHTPEGDYYIAPHHANCDEPPGCCDDAESCLDAAREQLAQVAAMGFNSLRIVGLAVIPEDGTVVLDCAHQWPTWLDYCPPDARLVMWPPDPRGLQLIADAVALTKEAGLRGILLAGHHDVDAEGVRDAYASYLEALSERFSDEPTLWAYDLTNEPVYEFANKDIDKVDANAIGRLWYDAVRAGSPRHMVTMGLAELGTVRHWDPGALPLDFTSFHIYGSGGWNDAVRDYLSTFLAWAGREPYPSMVGETGLSVEDGGPGDYEQRDFARHALETAWACGSMGFQWWLYRDVHWGPPGEHFGLVRWDGSVRPAAKPFDDFYPIEPRPPCESPDYWGSDPDGMVLTSGRVVDEVGAPVGNAFISGRRCITGGSDWTISKPDGTFELRSASLISELEVTAAGLSVEHVAIACNLATPGDVTLRALPLDMAISPPSACPE